MAKAIVYALTKLTFVTDYKQCKTLKNIELIVAPSKQINK